MQGLLGDFIREMSDRPSAWERTYCAQAICLWVHLVSGLDLSLGITATDEADAERITGGDLVNLIAYHCETVGLMPTDDPMPGDIAVVRVAGQDTCAVICGDGRVLIKTRRTARRLRAAIVQAWSVPERAL